MELERSTSISKPSSIGRATTLLWMAVIIAVTEVILDWPELTHANSANYLASLFLITLAFWCFLILKIGQGKNWARIVYLVFLVQAALNITSVSSEIDEHPLLVLISVCGLVIQVIAMILVFTGRGKEWFLAIQKTQ